MPLIPMAPPQAPPQGGAPPDLASLAALIGGGAPPPPGPDQGPPLPDQGGGGGPDDTDQAITDAINAVHHLKEVLTDAGDVATAGKCFSALAQIQLNRQNARQQAGSVGQQLAQRLGGGSAY